MIDQLDFFYFFYYFSFFQSHFTSLSMLGDKKFSINGKEKKEMAEENKFSLTPVNSTFKAYVLGFLAYGVWDLSTKDAASEKCVFLTMNCDDSALIKKVFSNIGFQVLIRKVDQQLVVEIESNDFVREILAQAFSILLKIQPDTHYHLQCPSWNFWSDQLSTCPPDSNLLVTKEDLFWVFVRGLFDGCNQLFSISQLQIDSVFVCVPRIELPTWSETKPFIHDLLEMTESPVRRIPRDILVIEGPSAFDLIASAYPLHDEKEILASASRLAIVKDWFVKKVRFPALGVYRVIPEAVLPKRKRTTDAGFDLVIISVSKQLDDQTTLYDTGIVVQPEHGCYVEVVPRSSLSSSGYMMANSPGIIDAGYRGSIKVALKKLDPKAADLQLPCRVAQMIPRQSSTFSVFELTKDQVHLTERGAKGFGSSGTNPSFEPST